MMGSLKTVHERLRIKLSSLRHQGIQSMLRSALVELSPETRDQLELLPQLEVQVGNSLTVNVSLRYGASKRKRKASNSEAFCLEAI